MAISDLVFFSALVGLLLDSAVGLVPVDSVYQMAASIKDSPGDGFLS